MNILHFNFTVFYLEKRCLTQTPQDSLVNRSSEIDTENSTVQIKDSLAIVATPQPKQTGWIGVERNFILQNEHYLVEKNLHYLNISNIS